MMHCRLRPPDPDYHVDDVFLLGYDDKNYFRPTSQLADSPLDATTLEVILFKVISGPTPSPMGRSPS